MTDKTTTTTIPAGSITVGMVTAGAEEVANYYDDGNDLQHREVARFVFQAMQRAAPSPAPAAPSAAQPAQDSLTETAPYRIRITPDMTYDQINAAASAPMDFPQPQHAEAPVVTDAEVGRLNTKRPTACAKTGSTHDLWTLTGA